MLIALCANVFPHVDPDFFKQGKQKLLVVKCVSKFASESENIYHAVTSLA